MTDEQEEQGIDPVVHDEQDSHAETWQEELPPEDDFHDQPELASSLTEESDLTSGSFDAGAPGRKSGATVMIGVIAVFVLFIGGMLYMQFGGSSGMEGSAIPFAPTEAANGPAVKNQGTAQKAFEPPVTPTSAEADITAIYNAGLAKTTAPTASTVAIPGGSEPDPNAVKPVTPEAKTSDIMTTSPLAPPAAVPSALMGPGAAKVEDTKPAAAPTVPAAPVAPQLQQAEAPAAAKSADMETRLTELSSQIEELKKALQETTQHANQMALRLEASPALETRLDRIEQQMAGLSAVRGEKSSVEPAVPASVEPAVPVKDETVTPRREPKKASKPKTQKPRATAKKESAKQKPVSWVLRAATPDSAWVSESAGSSELRTVKVGDTLPGVGKILSIRQTGEGWFVVGSKGTIR